MCHCHEDTSKRLSLVSVLSPSVPCLKGERGSRFLAVCQDASARRVCPRKRVAFESMLVSC